MAKGPYIRLTPDLHEISQYFPMNHNLEGRLDYDLVIDRRRHDEVSALLRQYGVVNRQTTQEFCFIVLWIENELRAIDDRENRFGKYYGMWKELDNLNQYLLNHRIISVALEGEVSKNKPGEVFRMKDPMNIDRICDGLRSIFKKEFQEKTDHSAKGQQAWKRKKMGMMRNAILKYLDSIPKLELLPVETHYLLIGQLSALAGYLKSESEYNSSRECQHGDEYHAYLIQHIRMLK